jgi:5-formyltetrahydrofolate cyclo-ligase
VSGTGDAGALAAAKARLREEAKSVRAGAYARHGSAAAESLAHHGLAFAGIAGSSIVSGFSAIGDEISALPLLSALARAGHRLALPVMQGKRTPLMFRVWRPGDATATAVWGIEEPLASAAAVDPDVLLVPLLAFDARGYRLGYGGGFYDRTLADLRARKHVIAIGLAFDEQRIEAVPHSDADQRLDWVLTPSGPQRAR